MTRTRLWILLIPLLLGCDPFSDMDASLENATSREIVVVFAATDSTLSRTIALAPGEIALFQQASSSTGSFLEPYLLDYDSVTIADEDQAVLRVYRPGDPGKNIYDIENSWEFMEPSRRFYTYLYRIEDVDLP